MGSTAYGSLIIDSELNIVGFNKDMEALYLGIMAGEKCYNILAKNNKQCAFDIYDISSFFFGQARIIIIRDKIHTRMK